MSGIEARMLEASKDAGFQRVLAESVREMAGGASRAGFPMAAADVRAAATGSSAAAATALFGTLAESGGMDGVESLAKTLELLQRLGLESGTAPRDGSLVEGDAAAAMEGASDEVITRVMEEFERMVRPSPRVCGCRYPQSHCGSASVLRRRARRTTLTRFWET